MSTTAHVTLANVSHLDGRGDADALFVGSAHSRLIGACMSRLTHPHDIRCGRMAYAL